MKDAPSVRRTSWAAFVHLALALPPTDASMGCRTPAAPRDTGGHRSASSRDHRGYSWTENRPQPCQVPVAGFVVSPVFGMWTRRRALSDRDDHQAPGIRHPCSRDQREIRRSRRVGRGRRQSSVVLGGGTGETEFYSWKETEKDIELRVPLPPDTPVKNIELEVTRMSLTLGLKGRDGPVLKGKLKGEVQAEFCNWAVEEETTGEKVLYLCLEKLLDKEHRGGNDWGGVLSGEQPKNVSYSNSDQEFDVEEYVKRMGYNRERDSDKVDKTMFSGLTEEMRKGLQERMEQGEPLADQDEIDKDSHEDQDPPVIDSDILGVSQTAFESSMEIPTSGRQMVEIVDDDAPMLPRELVDDVVGHGSEGAAGEKTGTKSEEEMTARRREVSAGLRETYDRLVASGVLKEEDQHGNRIEIPDMDLLAKEYDLKEHLFKDGDITDEEIRQYADAILLDDGPGPDVDIDDPAVRSAFGLD